MSLTGILSRITALFATVCFAVSVLYWFNYLTMGGGTNAVYLALWGTLLGIVSLAITAVLKWV